MADEARTVVPAEFFDQLVARLDEPAEPNEALREAFLTAQAAVRHRAEQENGQVPDA